MLLNFEVGGLGTVCSRFVPLPNCEAPPFLAKPELAWLRLVSSSSYSSSCVITTPELVLWSELEDFELFRVVVVINLLVEFDCKRCVAV